MKHHGLYTKAPKGRVWVCLACKKLSKTKSGMFSNGQSAKLSDGWDESCMLNSVLAYKSNLVFGENGEIVEVLR